MGPALDKYTHCIPIPYTCHMVPAWPPQTEINGSRKVLTEGPYNYNIKAGGENSAHNFGNILSNSQPISCIIPLNKANITYLCD